MKNLITERDVIDAWQSRTPFLKLTVDGIVSPAASDLAKAHGIEIVRTSADDLKLASRLTSMQKDLVFGADHGGFELKQTLVSFAKERGYSVHDLGTHSSDSVDYPDFAYAVAMKVAKSPGYRGIIVDGAGIGSAITANKVPGIRAANCHNVYTARNSREHNHANILTLGSQVVTFEEAREVLAAWLTTEVGGGRHKRRVEKILHVEQSFTR